MTREVHDITSAQASNEVTVLSPFKPRMQVSYFTANQHAIGAAYVHRMHHTTEEMLDRLETEREDEVYHRVCQRLGFDPLEDLS